MVSPIYFVSFVLTAQFVLVNVVIAVLMKHLEESNKEAKEEAEMEVELELENRLLAEAGDMAARSPQLNPLALGMDRSSSGGSPWRSTGGGDREQERDGPMDSPTADITRDSVNIRAEPPSCPEPPLEVINLFLCILNVVYMCECYCNFDRIIHHGSHISLINMFSKHIFVINDKQWILLKNTEKKTEY